MVSLPAASSSFPRGAMQGGGGLIGVLGKIERFFLWLEPSAEVKRPSWHPSSGETQRQRGAKGYVPVKF
ncbi:unnamed protein product [Ectocarpus sp. 12 AP-2014]